MIDFKDPVLIILAYGVLTLAWIFEPRDVGGFCFDEIIGLDLTLSATYCLSDLISYGFGLLKIFLTFGD